MYFIVVKLVNNELLLFINITAHVYPAFRLSFPCLVILSLLSQTSDANEAYVTANYSAQCATRPKIGFEFSFL